MKTDVGVPAVRLDPTMTDPFVFLVDADHSQSATEYAIARPDDLTENGEWYMQLASDSRLPPSNVETRMLIDIRQASLDYRRVMPYGRLCAQQFLDALAREGVRPVSRPVTLVDRVTGTTLPDRTYWWVPETVPGAIDLDRCEFTRGSSGRRITKLALRPDVVEGRPIFRPAGVPFYVVHRTLRSKLEAGNISGVAFATLDTAFDPGEGMRLTALGRQLAVRPDDAEVWFLAARSWRFVHRQTQALEAIDRALAIRPAFARARHLKGQVLREIGRLDEALVALEGALEGEELVIAIGDYAEVLLALGRVEDAAAQARRLMEADPDGPRSYLVTAKSELALGAFDEALTAAAGGLKHLGGSVYRDNLLQIRAQALMLQGRYEQALLTNEQAIAQSTAPQPFISGKAAALRALGRLEEAQQADAAAKQPMAKDDYDKIAGEGQAGAR